MPGGGYFYILECSDGSFYYGSTSNLTNRLDAHANKKVSSTKNKLPLKLIYKEFFPTYRQANRREYIVKSWKSRKHVVKLIETMAPSSSG